MVENGKGLTAIVAVSQNWGIGREGQLLFHLREDLRRFKELTMGHPVIMGRKTLQSLPGGRGLPGRRNLVLTRQPDFKAERAEAFSDVEKLLAAAGEDAFVIGGAEVYRLLLLVSEALAPAGVCGPCAGGGRGGRVFPGAEPGYRLAGGTHLAGLHRRESFLPVCGLLPD